MLVSFPRSKIEWTTRHLGCESMLAKLQQEGVWFLLVTAVCLGFPVLNSRALAAQGLRAVGSRGQFRELESALKESVCRDDIP